jgi:hypothetical protein
MPTNYSQVPPTGGASSSGPAYEPQVTPWNRDDDTSGVTETKPGDDYDGEGKARRKIARDPEMVRKEDEKIWNDKGLTPGYTEDIGETKD